MKNYIPLIIIMIFLVACEQDIINKDSKLSKEIQIKNYLNDLTKSSEYVGLQYIVFDKNGTIFNHSSGKSDLEKNINVIDETTFNIYSLTKIVTGISIIQLQEKGKLDINDKVSKYIDVPFKGITIKQLLNHSSGLPNPFLGNGYLHWKEDHKGFDRDKLFNEALKEHNEFIFKPGEDIEYSNFGYVILSYIIEKISGIKYEDYVIQNIFVPLKLDLSKIHFKDRSYSNSAEPYHSKNPFKFRIFEKVHKGLNIKIVENYNHTKNKWYFDFPSMGGIIANASEFSKIFSDLLKERSILLNKNSKEILFTKQTQIDNLSYSVSWEMNEDKKENVFYFHNGGGIGYTSSLRLYKDKGFGTILLLNTSDFAKLEINDKLDDIFLKGINP